jgi:predicted nucleic acid-binding Zn finger protein
MSFLFNLTFCTCVSGVVRLLSFFGCMHVLGLACVRVKHTLLSCTMLAVLLPQAFLKAGRLHELKAGKTARS